jgi:hypothetical protein
MERPTEQKEVFFSDFAEKIIKPAVKMLFGKVEGIEGKLHSHSPKAMAIKELSYYLTRAMVNDATSDPEESLIQTKKDGQATKVMYFEADRARIRQDIKRLILKTNVYDVDGGYEEKPNDEILDKYNATVLYKMKRYLETDIEKKKEKIITEKAVKIEKRTGRDLNEDDWESKKIAIGDRLRELQESLEASIKDFPGIDEEDLKTYRELVQYPAKKSETTEENIRKVLEDFSTLGSYSEALKERERVDKKKKEKYYKRPEPRKRFQDD